MTPDAAALQRSGEHAAAAGRSASEYGGTYFAARHNALQSRPALSHDIDVDICVIGGGLAGLTIAREASRRGWSVAVLEAERIACNASGRNTGFVVPGFAQDVDTIIERVGLDHARQVWALSEEGVAAVRRIVTEDMPEVLAGEGWLSVSKADRPMEISAEAETLRGLGADVETWPAHLVRSKLKSERYFQAIHFPGAFSVAPLDYALGLAKAAEQAGARIFEGTRALSIDPAGVRKRVMTPSGRVRAAHIVLAGNVYLGRLFSDLAATLIPVNNYAIVTRPIAGLADAIAYQGAVSDGARADSHYRVIDGDRLLFAGGMTVWQGNAQRYGRRLRRDILRLYPQLHGLEVEYAWRGKLGFTVHRMPQIGEVLPRVWLASGFGGQGLNTSAMAAQLIVGAIIEGDDRWKLFQPFELVYAGGRSVRALIQAGYWARRNLESLTHWQMRRRARKREREEARIKADAATPAETVDGARD